MKLRSFLVAMAFIAGSMLASAANAEDTAQLRQALSRVLPNFPATAKIIKTPYAGLYEVDVGGHLFYTDAKGSFLFAGEILDTRTGTNVTKARIEELDRVDWKTFPLKDSLSVVYGAGKRQIVVFEDPYCPYCHQLEQTLEKMGNMTVHVFLFPVIRPDSPAKARDVWCAPDRARAWQDWMDQQKAPPAASSKCDTSAIKANLALGQRLGVQSTPTMFMPNGDRLSGAVDAAEIEKHFGAK